MLHDCGLVILLLITRHTVVDLVANVIEVFLVTESDIVIARLA
jgi:hypothetical protein